MIEALLNTLAQLQCNGPNASPRGLLDTQTNSKLLTGCLVKTKLAMTHHVLHKSCMTISTTLSISSIACRFIC